MKSVIILGAGRVGEAVAFDLQSDYDVTLVDRDEDRLHHLGARYKWDTVLAPSPGRGELVQPFDLVVCAVPGFAGYETVKFIVEAGKPCVDVSFFEEDALALHDLAIEHKVPVAVDCGVAPGLFNLQLGHEDQGMKIKRMICYVGGLPRHPKPPYFYKAPFSPVDVIEIYTRPARIFESGRMVLKEAMSELESMSFDGIGTLEAFNSDGLRTLMTTMAHIPNMREKTLRWPGHIDAIKRMREGGFLSDKMISVGGQSMKAIDAIAPILFEEWKLGDDEVEFTIMRTVIEGDKETVVYDVFDERDKTTGLSSMARTTGFTCAAVARLFLEEKVSKPGVHAPEQIGQAGLYSEVEERLRRHGITIERRIVG